MHVVRWNQPIRDPQLLSRAEEWRPQAIELEDCVDVNSLAATTAINPKGCATAVPARGAASSGD